MNVIGSRPDGWWRDRTGAMRALVERLAGFAADGGREVTVVFDGRWRKLEADAADVAVLFVLGGRNAADDEIARLVAADAEPGELRVVTSDRELGRRVRASGAAVVAAGAFRRLIEW
jgi:predicted RNA-binding protein with PIN domain